MKHKPSKQQTSLLSGADLVTKQQDKQPAKPAKKPTPADEKRRLSAQCQEILNSFRLRVNKQLSNGELSQMALKYTSRISDLRQMGHLIKIVARDFKTGRVVYQLCE